MKKAMMMLLAILLAVSVAACAGNASVSSPPATAPASTAPATSESSASPAASGPVAEEVKGVTIPAFSIQINGKEVTQDSVAAYPMYSVQATSTNSSGTESTTTYVGFAMKDVLAAAGLTENYIWLQAIADDGYAVTLTGSAVTADTTLLAMTKDGSPFSSSPWVAPCSSATTGNYLKSAVSILVNTTEGAPDVAQTPSSGDSGGGTAPQSGSLPEILDRTDKVEFAPFSFKVNGQDVTNETLAGLHIYKITSTTTNNKGETVTSDYTGYKLADVLAAVGAGSSTNVTAVASDGFQSTLTAEMITSDYTLVAIEKDKEVGENGTVWVAPCAQATAGSYAKLVVEITAK